MSIVSGIKNTAVILVLVVLGVVLSPLLILYLMSLVLVKLYVRTRIKIKWPSEKYILFVYSQSEHWAPYIEEKILPSISEHTIVINRTTQQNWKNELKLEKRVIELWANIEDNPIAIVFKPKKGVKVFRFFEAFRDLKHGKESKLNELREEFYDYVSISSE